MIHVLIGRLIEREGGYVNDPDDRGGATNMGITQATLTAHRGYRVTAEQVRDMPREEAEEIYYNTYWLRPNFHTLGLSQYMEEFLLDAACHHGPRKAAELLQLAAGVKQDGMVGPVTAAACASMVSADLAAYFLGARVAFLGEIIENNRSQAKYAHGWMNRMQAFIRLIPIA